MAPLRTILLFAGLAACTGCTTVTYQLSDQEAQRAVQELRRYDETVVRVTKEETGRKVLIRLYRDDWLEFRSPRSDWEALRIDQVAEPARMQAAKYRHRNLGPGFLGAGLGVLAATTLINGLVAGAVDDPLQAVPIYGPFRGVRLAARSIDNSCEPTDSLCTWSNIGAGFYAFYATLWGVIQVVGLGLSVTGLATYRPSRETDAYLERASWDLLFHPAPMGQGGHGGALTVRF